MQRPACRACARSACALRVPCHLCACAAQGALCARPHPDQALLSLRTVQYQIPVRYRQLFCSRRGLSRSIEVYRGLSRSIEVHRGLSRSIEVSARSIEVYRGLGEVSRGLGEVSRGLERSIVERRGAMYIDFYQLGWVEICFTKRPLGSLHCCGASMLAYHHAWYRDTMNQNARCET